MTGIVLTVSVTWKFTRIPSRRTLPATTSPPTRKARSCGAFCAITSDGVKEKTRLSRNAVSPPSINANRLWRAFIVCPKSLSFVRIRAAGAIRRLRQRTAAAQTHACDLADDQRQRRAVRHPDKVAVPAHGKKLLETVPVHCHRSGPRKPWQPARRKSSAHPGRATLRIAAVGSLSWALPAPNGLPYGRAAWASQFALHAGRHGIIVRNHDELRALGRRRRHRLGPARRSFAFEDHRAHADQYHSDAIHPDRKHHHQHRREHGARHLPGAGTDRGALVQGVPPPD